MHLTWVVVGVVTVLVFSVPTIKRVLQSWKFLIKGRDILLEMSRKSSGKAFSVPVPGNRLHVMSTKEHWEDINRSSQAQLSSMAASREMFQPKHTFGFSWSTHREHVSLITVRSLKISTALLELYTAKLIDMLDKEFTSATRESTDDGWSQIPMWETIQRAVTRMNTLIILGEDLAQNDEFLTSGLRFTKQVSLVLEAVRLVPSFLASYVTKLIKGDNRDQRYVFEKIAGAIEQRRQLKSPPPPQSFLEAFVDASSDDETTTKIVDAINVQWVTSTLSVPIVCCHAIQDLYLHPDFAEPLKIEANSRPLAEAKFDEMPVLEAFIMESLRSHCFQSTTCHRMTVDQFRFSDGYTIPPGEMVKFHSHRMLLDENLYPDSRSFNPNRFSNTGKSLVDTGMEWPFWGVPKMICPGRWQVSYFMKLVSAYMAVKFEGKLDDSKPLNMFWRDASVPNPDAVLSVRPLAA